MNALAALWRLTVLGSEYTAAWGVATRVLDKGGSVTTALRAFAAETEAELDDQAIDLLVEFVGDTRDKLALASQFCMRAAYELENRGPFIVSLLRTYGARASSASARLSNL
jgi:hypothetical protein